LYIGDLEAEDAEGVSAMSVALFSLKHHFFVCSLHPVLFFLWAELLTARQKKKYIYIYSVSTHTPTYLE
jgi:hypothetical protein